MEREEHVWHAFAAVMSSLCAARTETQDDETSWESGLDSAHAVPDSRLQFHSIYKKHTDGEEHRENR